MSNLKGAQGMYSHVKSRIGDLVNAQSLSIKKVLVTRKSTNAEN